MKLCVVSATLASSLFVFLLICITSLAQVIKILNPPPLHFQVESKKFSEIIEYYYTWKKYCSDEYRGRNRHISEEV